MSILQVVTHARRAARITHRESGLAKIGRSPLVMARAGTTMIGWSPRISREFRQVTPAQHPADRPRDGRSRAAINGTAPTEPQYRSAMA